MVGYGLPPALLCFVPSSIKSSYEPEGRRTDQKAPLFILWDGFNFYWLPQLQRAMVVLDWMLGIVDVESGERGAV